MKESEQLLGVVWGQLNMPHGWPLIFRVLASSLNKNVLLPRLIIMIINTYYFSSISLAYWYAVAHFNVSQTPIEQILHYLLLIFYK